MKVRFWFVLAALFVFCAALPFSVYADDAAASVPLESGVVSDVVAASSVPAASSVVPASASVSSDSSGASVLLAASSSPAASPVAVIWDKPFTDYSPTEGYLFLLFVIACIVVFFKTFEWGVIRV